MAVSETESANGSVCVAEGVYPNGTTFRACSLRDWFPECQFWNDKYQRECSRIRANGSRFCTYHKNRMGK